MKKEIIDSVFEEMKAKDFGESMCDETKLRVLKWCGKQLHKHFVSKRYCLECGCDITNSRYALICENCRIQV